AVHAVHGLDREDHRVLRAGAAAVSTAGHLGGRLRRQQSEREAEHTDERTAHEFLLDRDPRGIRRRRARGCVVQGITIRLPGTNVVRASLPSPGAPVTANQSSSSPLMMKTRGAMHGLGKLTRVLRLALPFEVAGNGSLVTLTVCIPVASIVRQLTT